MHFYLFKQSYSTALRFECKICTISNTEIIFGSIGTIIHSTYFAILAILLRQANSDLHV